MPIAPKSSYKRSYPWAANNAKLGEAIRDLEEQKKLNPTDVIDEEAIKARYIVRKGALIPQDDASAANSGADQGSGIPGTPKPTKAAKSSDQAA